MSRGAGTQGPGSPTEAENRAILILGGILLLLIFLDRQASEQINLRAATPNEPGALIEEKVRDGASDSRDRLESIREALHGETTEGVESGLEKGEAALEERLLPVKRPIKDILNSRMEDPGRETIRPEQLQSDPRVEIPNSSRSFHLYFLRFNGSESRMVRVSRSTDGPVSYSDVISALQHGPADKESGLLTAMDRSIKVHSVIEEDGVITLDLGVGIHRMGPSIIRDRIHQICLTLFQFSHIKAVRILVDGQKPEYLGKGSDRLRLPDFLGYPDRKVEIFTGS